MSAVWYPFDVYPDAPRPHIIGAEGVYLLAQDGQQYLDAIGSWWVCLHGHRHPRLMAALHQQAALLDQIIYAGFTHSPAEDLAAALVASYPGAHKCFYSDDGSTAVEVALKLALHAQTLQGRPKASRILTLANSYHGDTIGAMSAAQQGVFTKPYTSYLFDAEVLKISYTTDIFAPLGPEDTAVLASAEAAFASGTFAAFICEPLVQGAGGMRFYKIALLAQLWALARQHHVFIIADEVMTGFGRTGRLFAADWLPTAPDFACLSKGLTGGVLPLGVTLASQAIWAMFAQAAIADRFLHGHSFTANAITCAVALESWHLLQEPAEVARCQALYHMLGALAGRLRQVPKLKNVRQLGGIVAAEVAVPGVQGYLNSIGPTAYAFFLARGLLIRPLGNTLYLLPPYCFMPEHVQQCEEALVAFVEQL